MRLFAFSSQCCPVEPDVNDYRCLWRDMLCEYDTLRHRYRKLVTKRSRIHELSVPRVRYEKHKPCCICLDVAYPKYTIVRDDKPSYTRTEQLALPKIARLLDFRQTKTFKRLPAARKEVSNRLLRKSIHSLYTRLANVPVPESPKPKRKWTAAEEQYHREYNTWLAQSRRPEPPPEYEEKKEKTTVPKPTAKKGTKGQRRSTVSQVPELDAKAKTNESIERMHRLCRPVRPYKPEKPKEWVLTEEARNYKPSKRILEISKPRYINRIEDIDPTKVKESALHYKASQRINELAIPVKVPNRRKSNNPDVFKVKRSALTAKTSERMKEISQPREYTDVHTRSNPFKVSPKALRFKTTQRLIEMSKPKIKVP